MKNLWCLTKACNETGDSVPLPPYLCIAFSSPEMTGRMREERDLTVRVIGRCIEALVVCKLTADIKSRTGNAYPRSHELACLSGILGTDCGNINAFFKYAGAIEFTNMVFLALDDIYSFTLETMPLYAVEMVQETFNSLSRALPESLAKMRPKKTSCLMGVSESQFELVLRSHFYHLKMFVRHLISNRCNVSERFTRVDERPVAFCKRVQ